MTPPPNPVIPSGERSSAKRTILRSRGTCCLPTPPRKRLPHSSRTLRRVEFHSPIPLRIRKASRPGRPRRQPHRKPSQNLVIPSGERSSARRMILRSRGTCCKPTPPRNEAAPFFAHFAKSGIPHPIPLRIRKALRPGRPRLQSCHKPRNEAEAGTAQ